jgi:hypothetical protein
MKPSNTAHDLTLRIGTQGGREEEKQYDRWIKQVKVQMATGT